MITELFSLQVNGCWTVSVKYKMFLQFNEYKNNIWSLPVLSLDFSRFFSQIFPRLKLHV